MGALDNKTILFSGVFAGHERKDLEKQAVAAGAKLLSGVSKNLNYLVAGDKMGPQKRVDANKLGVAILDLDEFFAMLNPQAAAAQADFWQGLPKGSSSSKVLVDYFKEVDWKKFDPHHHGEALRDTLAEHEAKHGVTDVHKTVSDAVRSHLTLLHPYGHDSEWAFSDMSPDGKWLAIGSWIGEDYDRGGILQIWEVATGRLVNNLRIRGGVGWPDYKAMEWSPDSSEIALAFDTNGIGVWDPFGKTKEPRVHAYITDGWSRPPGFTWYPDSKAVFIQCALFDGFDESIFEDDDDKREAYFEDEKNGCRMDVYQRRGDMFDGVRADRTPASKTTTRQLRVFAHLLGIKPGKDSMAYKDDDGNIAVCNAESVSFYRADKSLYGQYIDRDPGSDSPMVIDYEDYGKDYSINPAFGINIKKQEYWGLAFEEGVIVAPSDFDAAKYLNWSLGRHWSWPLDWCACQRYETTEAWYAAKPTEAPYWLRDQFKEKSPAKPAAGKAAKSKTVKASTPEVESKTYDDIRTLAVNGIKGLHSGWDSFRGEKLIEIAICDLLHGDIDRVSEILELIPQSQYTEFASQIGFHSLKRFGKLPIPDLEKKLMDAVKDISEYDIAPANAYLAMFFYQSGKKKEGDTYADIAIKHRQPETNFGQNGWPIVDMLVMSGRAAEAFKYQKEWDLRKNSFSGPVFTNVIWYGSIEDMRQLISTLQDYEAASLAADKIIYDKDWDSTPTFEKQLKDYYHQCADKVGEAMIRQGVKADIYQMLPALKESGNYTWHRALNRLIQYLPDQIATYFKKTKPELAQVANVYDEDDKYQAVFSFARAVQMAGIADQYEQEASQLSDNLRVGYLLGLAAASEPDTATKLIQQAMSSIPKTVDIYRRETIFKLSCLSAYTSRSPLYDQFVSDAQEEAIRKDKDLSVYYLSESMIAYGDIETARKTWLKIPKGKRHYRMDKLMRYYCEQKDYNQIYAFLMGMNDDNLNDRPSNAISALSVIVDGRKDNLKF